MQEAYPRAGLMTALYVPELPVIFPWLQTSNTLFTNTRVRPTDCFSCVIELSMTSRISHISLSSVGTFLEIQIPLDHSFDILCLKPFFYMGLVFKSHYKIVTVYIYDLYAEAECDKRTKSSTSI